MSLNRSPDALRPELLQVFEAGLKLYNQRHPHGPRMSFNETSRNELVQEAYHAQGRVNLAPLNALRAKAGLPALKLAEARNVISNARYGESAHNFAKARAFDTKAEQGGVYIGSREPYYNFWLCCKEAAAELKIAITWGGTWKDYPHIELTHWRTMS